MGPSFWSVLAVLNRTLATASLPMPITVGSISLPVSSGPQASASSWNTTIHRHFTHGCKQQPPAVKYNVQAFTDTKFVCRDRNQPIVQSLQHYPLERLKMWFYLQRSKIMYEAPQGPDSGLCMVKWWWGRSIVPTLMEKRQVILWR